MNDSPQKSLAQVRRMRPEQVAKALKAGELDGLLAGRDPEDEELEAPEALEQATRDELRAMTPEQVRVAEKEGRLADLLGHR